MFRFDSIPFHSISAQFGSVSVQFGSVHQRSIFNVFSNLIFFFCFFLSSGLPLCRHLGNNAECQMESIFELVFFHLFLRFVAVHRARLSRLLLICLLQMQRLKRDKEWERGRKRGRNRPTVKFETTIIILIYRHWFVIRRIRQFSLQLICFGNNHRFWLNWFWTISDVASEGYVEVIRHWLVPVIAATWAQVACRMFRDAFTCIAALILRTFNWNIRNSPECKNFDEPRRPIKLTQIPFPIKRLIE